MPLFIQRATGGEIAAGNALTEWTSKGERKGMIPEYVRRIDPTLHGSAYDGTY